MTTQPFDPRSLAYANQGPGQAFTRYLAGMQGGGAPMSNTIQDLLQERGRYLSYLAPLSGYGIDQEIPGGKGQDFGGYFKQQGFNPGSYGQNMDYMRQAQGAVGKLGQQKAYDAGYAADQTAKSKWEADPLNKGTDGTIAPYQSKFTMQNPGVSDYDMALGGTYNDPSEQLRATQANMALRVNPVFRGGLMRQLGDQFENQQAMSPNQSWWDYLQANGRF